MTAIAIALLFHSASAIAEVQRPARDIIQAHVSASVFLASFDGTLQTPLGGATGSTNASRPTTKEVGLKGLEVHALVDGELRLFNQHGLHVSYAELSQSGSRTITKRLVTHGQTVPAGARVNSRLELPFVRLGYRAHWLGFGARDWKFAPEFGVSRVDFHYRLRAPEATGPIDRAYVVYFAYWGLNGGGAISERLRGEVDFLASAGLSNVVSIDTDFRLLYRLVETEYATASLVAGVRGIWFRYKDDQRDEQNKINVRSGAFSRRPWAGAHLGVRLSY